MGEWVRRARRGARMHEPETDPHVKLKAIRDTVQHSFPTADVDQMLAEIERGYLK